MNLWIGFSGCCREPCAVRVSIIFEILGYTFSYTQLGLSARIVAIGYAVDVQPVDFSPAGDSAAGASPFDAGR